MTKLAALLFSVTLLFTQISAQVKDTLVLAVSPAGTGTVSGQGIYDAGSRVNVQATPVNGYQFSVWLDKEGRPYNGHASFDANSAFKKLTASFLPVVYSIYALATTGGTVTSSGQTPFGGLFKIEAIADAGYEFKYWMDETRESETMLSRTAVFSGTAGIGDKKFRAYFQAKAIIIKCHANPARSGNVYGPANATLSSTVQLRAEALAGYRFVNWTDDQNIDLSHTASFSTVFDRADKIYFANFAPLPTFSIVSSPAEGGLVRNETGQVVSRVVLYETTTSVALTALPSNGFTFRGWSINGKIQSSSPSYSVPITNDPITAIALFKGPPTISVVASPNAPNTVAVVDSKGVNVKNSVISYTSSVTLTAVPVPGWIFTGWSKPGGAILSTNPAYTYMENKDEASTVLMANFDHDIPSTDFTVLANPAAGGSVTGSGRRVIGALSTVTATPAPGWMFVNWTDRSGAVINTTSGGANNSLVVTVTNAASLNANFKKVETLNVVANPSSGGAVKGGGTFNANTLVTVVVNVAPGWVFLNWTDASNRIVAQTPAYETSSGAGTLTANFGKNLKVNATAGGGTMGTGVYAANTRVNVTAMPQQGYMFVNWTDVNGQLLSDRPVYAANSDMGSITANFTKQTPVTVTAISKSPELGTVTGGGSFMPGTQITLVATPAAGKVFAGWSIGTANFSTATITYTVPYTNVTAVAVFR